MMRVTRNTPEQLIVEDTPWFIGVMLILFILVFVGAGLLAATDTLVGGLAFALIGGGLGASAFTVFVRRVMVILDADANALILRRSSVFGRSEVSHTLSDVDRAMLEETTSDSGRSLYRPSLVLSRGVSAGIHPIVDVYTNTPGPRRLVAAINDWLAAHRRAPDGTLRTA
jgi:hypothetical protein